ncbi:MAG: AAA family ATPase [Bacteroidales bacterium]|nr:AAA family ATPase [Bacteroidales bacterium]
MITDHFKKITRQYLGHPPTPGQESLIGQLIDFILGERDGRIFVVKGFAGTGKTTLISALVKTLDEMNVKTLLLAPTGRAAKVFSGYAGKTAYTIHRKIYRQKSSTDGFGEFALNKNLYTNLIILVDEASMIPDTVSEGAVFGTGRLLADLISYVSEGQQCKLILIGDTAQLPPVGIAQSPALDKNELTLYLPVAGEYMLTDIVRQTRNSGILENATIVRDHITKSLLNVPRLHARELNDTQFIAGTELIDAMENAYRKHGPDEVMVLCRSNKRANQYNAGIRKQILFREEELTAGDMLMVVKNNYYWLRNQPDLDFVANGDIVRVVKTRKYEERYGFRFARAVLQLIDYDVEFEAWIMLDTLVAEKASLSQDDNKRLYYSVLEDYAQLESRSKQYKAVKEDEFFNALQVKYAYAITCHKAQGGQWKSVFIDQGYVDTDNIDLEYLRWLYTAITRATEELFFVNFAKAFQDE